MSATNGAVGSMSEAWSLLASVAPMKGEDNDPVIGAVLFFGGLLGAIVMSIVEFRRRRRSK